MTTLTKDLFTIQIPNHLGIAPVVRQNSPTFFDGRNLWVTATHGIYGDVVWGFKFWGPYRTLDNDFYPRWAEIAVDEVTLGAMGPNFPAGATNNKIELLGASGIANDATVLGMIRSGPSEWTIAYTNGWRAVRSDAGTQLSLTQYVKPTVQAPAAASMSAGNYINDLGATYTPAGTWLINSITTRSYLDTPTCIWAIEQATTSQDGADVQFAYRYDAISKVKIGTAITIPGRKQALTRYMAYNDGKVYIGSYNQRGVYVFDAASGAYIRWIEVNRDVAEMFVYAGKVYVSSRNGLFSSIDTTYNVVDIGDATTRNYYIGFLAVGQPTVSDAAWIGLSDDVFGRYDAGATAWEIITEGTTRTARYFRKDNRAGQKFKMYDDTVRSIAYTPPIEYQYFVNNAFTTVKVPEHLFMITSTGLIKAARLPNLYYGGTNKIYGGVMAVSTGIQRYKGDNI